MLELKPPFARSAIMLLAGILALALPSCAAPSATNTPTRESIPGETPSPLPATPTPTSLPMLSLDEPKWLGRGEMVDAVFSQDAELLAIGWMNGVSLFAVQDSQELWWQPTVRPVLALDLHPEGKAVAAALEDGSVIIFDVATGQERRFEAARPSSAYWGDLSWSPDGKRIAFQFIGPGLRTPIYLLDVESGSLGQVPNSWVSQAVPWLLWSPDSRAISRVLLGENCSQLLDIETGEIVLSLEGQQGCYERWAGAASPDGRLLALVNWAGIDLLDSTTWQVVRSMEGNVLNSLDLVTTKRGESLIFSPDGSLMASLGGLGYSGEAYPTFVWDVTTGDRIAQLGRELPAVYEGGPERPAEDWADIASLRDREPFAIGFDGSELVILHENGELGRWHFTTPYAEERIVAKLQVISAQPVLLWSVEGNRLAAINLYGGAAVWDVPSGLLLQSFDQPLTAPALSPDGRLIALTDPEGNQEVIYEIETGTAVQTLPESTALPLATAFSPDGGQIAYGSGNRVIIADVASGELIAVLGGHPGGHSILRVVWSPSGDALVTAGGYEYSDEPGDLILWQNTPAGSFEERFRTETTRVGYEEKPLALFNPSGNLVAMEQFPTSQGKDLDVVVYDLSAGEVQLTIREHELAEWMSEDELLTSQAGNGSWLVAWNVRTAEQSVAEAYELGDNVYAPDGRFFARTNVRGRNIGRGIEVHDWLKDQRVARDELGADVLRISWSPDGRWIAAITSRGAIRVWPVRIPGG